MVSSQQISLALFLLSIGYLFEVIFTPEVYLKSVDFFKSRNRAQACFNLALKKKEKKMERKKELIDFRLK